MEKRQEAPCDPGLNCENQILHNLHKMQSATVPGSSETIQYKKK